MPTINVSSITPPTVIAAWRDDDWTTIDDVPAHEWLAKYWLARIRAVRPEPHDEEPHGALVELAYALATEVASAHAVGIVMDYREFTDRPANDGALIRMMLDALLDWSKWTGDARIDDARAESWLRSLLS
jgi:hypothetical protein